MSADIQQGMHRQVRVVEISRVIAAGGAAEHCGVPASCHQHARQLRCLPIIASQPEAHSPQPSALSPQPSAHSPISCTLPPSPRQDSVELHHKLSGSLSGPALSLARRRSARSGPVALTAVAEEPSPKAAADSKAEAPAV